MHPKPEGRRKAKPSGDSAYIGWVKLLPCVRCGEPGPSEFMHIAGAVSFKTGLPLPRRSGIAFRVGVPGCPTCHRTGRDSIHAVGEAAFFLAFDQGEGLGPRLALSYLATYLTVLESGAI